MIIKRKLYSQVEEEERMYARGVGKAVKAAMKKANSKGNKIANKRKKQLFEEVSKNRIIGEDMPATKRQFRKIMQSGVTPNKHALSTGVGGPITRGNDLLLNFEPSIPTNHSINIKGINEHVKLLRPKEIIKKIHNDPGKGTYTRFRIHLD